MDKQRVDNGLNLTDNEMSSWFQDPAISAEFPPLLSVAQAAKLLQVPVNTIYLMSSRGDFDSCRRRVGKHLLLVRNRLLETIFNKPLNRKTSTHESAE